MTRRYVEALLQMGDRNLFLGGMMSWTGFRQIGLPVLKKQRNGQSTYTLLQRIGLMVNAVSSFSAQPLVWLFNIGGAITMLSFSFAFYLVFRKLFFDDALLGFTSVMTVMMLSLGILTTAMGSSVFILARFLIRCRIGQHTSLGIFIVEIITD